jgi:hypothetical protein
MSSENIQQITSMGYSEAAAEKALKIAGGDMEQAVGYLLLSTSSRGGFEKGSTISDDAKPPAQPRPEPTPEANYSDWGMTDAVDDPEDPSYYQRESNIGDVNVPTKHFSSMISEMTNPSFASINHGHSGFGSGSGNGLGLGNGEREKKVDELVEMGYPVEEANQALRVTDGDIDQAVGFLLMGESSRMAFLSEVTDSFSIAHDVAHDGDDAKLAASMYLQQEEERLILQIEEHQHEHQQQKQRPEYTMYNAKHKNGGNVPKMVITNLGVTQKGVAPFCTCVAARNFLDGGVVNALYLDSILERGLELFQQAGRKTDYNVEKVMMKFGKTQSLGLIAPKTKVGLFQPHDLQNERGLRNLLIKVRNEQPVGWEVSILEVDDYSFCLCMPPKGTANKFWIIDLRARSEFKTKGAYARVHTSLLQLEESLEYIMKVEGRKARKETQNFTLHVVSQFGDYVRAMLK